MKRLLILAALSLLLIIVTGCQPARGKVISRQFQPSRWVFGSDGKGRMTFHYVPEVWCVVIQNDDGTVVARNTTATAYAQHPEGTRWDEK